VGQERLGPSYFFISLVLGPLNSFLWYVPSSRGIFCFQRPGRNLVVRVGREEEGVSSLRPELAMIASTLQATVLEVDLLYLCYSEAALNKVSQWIGIGPRTTFAGDANIDIITSIIKCIRERVLRGARTFLVKVKAHRVRYTRPRKDDPRK